MYHKSIHHQVMFVVRFSIQNIPFLLKAEFHYITPQLTKTLQQTSYQRFFLDVRLEPQLKPFAGEIYHYRKFNTTADTRIDVPVLELWVFGQLEFLDITVCNPLAKCYNSKVNPCNTREREKRSYNCRIIEIKNYYLLVTVEF